ncbi:unnamed protein product [Orchesella dallaii]|uniref:E3 SUMO-protein ligase NSE2 n=1 Tax=Orchesella dallaii TaxID=48710 RepID=A0ABP1Q6I7_9HEXA
MPRKGRGRGGRNSGGMGYVQEHGHEDESDVGSDEVLDSDGEGEETDRVEEEVDGGSEETMDKQDEAPQPGPSTKSRLARGGGKKQGNKPNAKSNALGPDETVHLNLMSEVIDDLMLFLSDTAKLILPLLEGKNKEKKKTLKRLHDIGVKMTESQEKLKIVPEAVMAAYNNLDLEELVDKEQDIDQLIAILDEFDEASTKEMEKRNKKVNMKVVYKNETYQKFLEVLDQFYDRRGKGIKAEEEVVDEDPGASTANLGACSEGIEALSEYIPTTDPFTRQTLKDPYENKICKHVYEYQSVMDMLITSGGRTRCPYPGCLNKKYIQLEDLHKNVHVAAKIAARITEEKDRILECNTVD